MAFVARALIRTMVTVAMMKVTKAVTRGALTVAGVV